jgi:putative aminopeptidase FrvX
MSESKHNLKELFRELNHVIGVSGSEQEIIKTVYKSIKPYADEVHVSTTGNITAVKRAKKSGPSVLIASHMDEVGYVVRNILHNGFLTLDKVGTAPDSVAIGRKVWVSSEKIPGIIGIKPGHLQSAEEAKRITPLDKNFVDLGVNSAEEAKALGIRIGDPVIIQSDFMEMSNPDFICTRAVDNRISCAIIIELFRNLNADDFSGTVYGVFTVREEAGLRGAANAVFNYHIDYALVLDTIPVADTPDYNHADDLPMYLDKGPGFPIYEAYGSTFFQIVHPGLRKMIEGKSAEAGIELQIVTLAFANYCTDACSLAYVKDGIPTATLAVPRRYSHSPVELFSINDAVKLLQLLEVIVNDNENADISFVTL